MMKMKEDKRRNSKENFKSFIELMKETKEGNIKGGGH